MWEQHTDKLTQKLHKHFLTTISNIRPGNFEAQMAPKIPELPTMIMKEPTMANKIATLLYLSSLPEISK